MQRSSVHERVECDASDERQFEKRMVVLLLVFEDDEEGSGEARTTLERSLESTLPAGHSRQRSQFISALVDLTVGRCL